ncbi:MAG: Gfo/Idh/MocA family oxidoreductase [Anaerolineaceae bacterium]|jgi:predicted dehydrogenase|nr:Gfo/Idh/MocA family oxidoreductase [Anaerolineaceae bacterium]
MKKEGFAVIGSGYWGMNYVRLLSQMPETELIAVCDQAQDRLDVISQRFPKAALYQEIAPILADKEIEAVVVCTNPASHFEVAKQLLMAGKHVLVEKPMTLTAATSGELVKIAKEKKLTLMVGHIFLYHPAVDKVKSYIESGDLGEMHYMYAQRTNLGPIREDVNALWDLAPHDVSIFNHLMDANPVWVSAVGTRFLRGHVEDAGFIVLGYENGTVCNIHVSWADPHKVREVVVVGSKQRISFNDTSPDEKVRVFEKGVAASATAYSDFGEYQLMIRDGDVISPKIPFEEPLKNEVLHFIGCKQTGKQPRSDGMSGMVVVKVMEAVNESVRNNGAPVYLKY